MFDPATVLYTYQSPPGYLLTAIYFPAWIYFVCNCVHTGFKFERKRAFYLALGNFYSLWLLAVPVLILIANRRLDDWVRMKTVTIAQQLVWILSYSFFLYIFRPCHGNKEFPFHLRATRVGGSEFEQEKAAQDTNYAVENGEESGVRTQRENLEEIQSSKDEQGLQMNIVEHFYNTADIFTVKQ